MNSITKNSPKISVIMPVYNTEKRVGKAIESVLMQTFQDFELIIVDDGSTDGSYEICSSYAKKDKRIKLYKNIDNKGISYTRNRLVSLSTTEYIATQDSDDITPKDRLQIQYDFLSNNSDYGVVSGDDVIIDKDDKKIGFRKYSDNISYHILKENPISNSGSMFRKSVFNAVGGYDEKISYGEDYDLWLRFYMKGYGIKNLPHTFLACRIRNGQSRNHKMKDNIRNTIQIQKKYISLGLRPTLSDNFHIFLEKCLLILPNPVIMRLFKFLKY